MSTDDTTWRLSVNFLVTLSEDEPNQHNLFFFCFCSLFFFFFLLAVHSPQKTVGIFSFFFSLFFYFLSTSSLLPFLLLLHSTLNNRTLKTRIRPTPQRTDQTHIHTHWTDTANIARAMSGSSNTTTTNSSSSRSDNNTANGRFANAADLLLYRGHFSPETLSPSPRSPITSPLSSPLSSPRKYPSNPSNTHHTHQPASFDLLPPAMSAHGATPAPSEDHSDMVSHHADMVDDDDEEEALEDHRYNNRRRSPQSHSRPSSPPLPPTTATILSQPNPNSLTVTPSSSFSSSSTTRSDGGPSSSTASPSQTIGSDHHTSHSHVLSPFSFFSHGSHSPHGEHHSTKTLKIELTHPEVILMAGQTTMLEGVVYVNLHKTTKVKSLHLEFSGRSSVTWVDGKTDIQKFNPCIPFFISLSHRFVVFYRHKEAALSPNTFDLFFSLSLFDGN